jgi:hypothetical protein
LSGEDGVFAAPLPLLVRSDARRPASWLACGLAAAAVASLAATGTGVAAVTAAIACGGWAAAAAAGRPPRGLVPGMVRLDAAWWWERAAWPLAGCLAAAAGRWLWAGDGAAIAVGLAIGVGVMTALAVAAATRGATAADATSLGLVVATAAAAAAANGRSPVEALACAGGAAAGLAAAAWAAWRHGRGWSWHADPQARTAASFAELGMARGGVRSALAALAMLTSLTGMAVWYFLAPAAAAAGTFVALGWFTALAVPAVLLGPAGHVAWRRLVATTAGPAGSRRPGGPAGSSTQQTASSYDSRAGSRRLVGPAGAAAVACGHAVVLGWPPVVAGLLLAVEGGLEPASVCVWPWLTVAALAVAAALLVALALAASAARIDAETTLAWAAGLVILALLSLPQTLPPPQEAPGGNPGTPGMKTTPPPPQEAPGGNPGTPGMKTTPPSMPSNSPRFSAAPRLAW